MLYRCIIVLASLTLLGADCGDEPAPVQPIAQHTYEAIQAWKAQGLKWDAATNTRCPASRTSVYTTPQDDLPNKCPSGAENLIACLDGNWIWVASEYWGIQRTDYIIEHELRHWMAGCAYATVDGAHADMRFWYTYRGVDIRE